MSRLKKNIVNSLLVQFPVQGLGVLSSILVTRILGPEGKGVFALYNANASLFIAFLSISFSSALTYFISNKKIKIEKLLGIGISIIFIALIILLVFVFAFKAGLINRLLLPKGHIEFNFLIWLISFSLFSIINSFCVGILQGFKKFSQLNLISLVNAGLIFFVFGTIYTALKVGFFIPSVSLVLWVTFIVVIINLLFYFYYLKEVKIDFSDIFKIEKSAVRKVLRYLTPVFVSILINFINYKFSFWVINYFLTVNDIGLFSIAINIGFFLTMISTTVSSVMFPYLVQNQEDARGEIFKFYARLNFTFILSLCILVASLSHYIIPLMYGEAFLKSAFILLITLPGVLFASQTKIFSTILLASGNQNQNLIATIIGFIINIPTCIFFINKFGIFGAAVSYILTYLVIFLSVMFSANLLLKVNLLDTFILKKKDFRKIF